MAPLEGKVVAITGASSGIGEATAIALAEAGARVSLGARRADRLDALVEQIGSDRALAIETDITDEEQARAFIQRTKDELGSVDVLVNNAGVMLLGLLLMQESNDWRRMIEVNQLGLLYCSHEALKVMTEQGGGHIINVSSVAGRIAALGSAVYNMTKWGVTGFSEALRQEGIHVNVRVTCIEPGFVETELQGHNTNPMVVDAMEKSQAEIGKVLEAKDIANAILYAVSQPEHVGINEVLVRPTKQAR
ncbi:MAG TPA: SDR family NAD(P)-dependent oxidoreductase [Thermoleophilaceae bacterium]|nr:SDR family NAD(P)-dependent oxidoreductase [Thermoleophilaceae bacterium]